MNPGALLAQEGVRNDSLGSPLNNISPFWVDGFAVALLYAVYVQGDVGIFSSLGILLACVMMVWCALRTNAFYHFIVDTPKSKIKSASNGFVEFYGTCDLFGNRQTQGFLTGPPCVWHRYSIWSRGPVPYSTGASTLPFSLTDESGGCVVDPRGAKIISSSRRTWIADGKRISSSYIHPGANVYILGELRSSRSATFEYKKTTEIGKLLAIWKKDKRWLTEEFDHNGDGDIDSNEWESVRERAEIISRRLHSERTSRAEEASVIGKPSNGMPFIIADRDPAVLGTTFRMLSLANIACAILCFAWFCLRLI